ncbi:hypothetical protein CCH79_00009548 [Gambusia affinis]|uniref:Uncharacterized protein n=1 Tax=Gambusia affinis TaxID=33528 RepID=A0A315VEK3_GAMAF|nr:hypothetical protein CCH79_00009548 [Gambusia affinis]
MPTSRPGSEPVEFWVDGSRRDGTVEDFYGLGSELGRSGLRFLGRFRRGSGGLFCSFERAKVGHMWVHVTLLIQD